MLVMDQYQNHELHQVVWIDSEMHQARLHFHHHVLDFRAQFDGEGEDVSLGRSVRRCGRSGEERYGAVL